MILQQFLSSKGAWTVDKQVQQTIKALQYKLVRLPTVERSAFLCHVVG